MNRCSRCILLWVVLAISSVLLGCACSVFAVNNVTVGAVADPGLISVPDAYSFVPPDLVYDDAIIGVFLKRSAVQRGITYHGSVSAQDIIDNNGFTSFNPTYTAMVKHDDVWETIPVNSQGQCEGPFRIDSTFDIEQSDKSSVGWYLDAEAPAAVYGIKCTYEDADTVTKNESIFNVVYTDAWTYLTALDDSGASSVTGFKGGRNRTLTLQITFNDGATTPTLEEVNGKGYGAIRNKEIIGVDTLQFTMKTFSGKIYDGNISVQRIPNTNLVTLMFEDALADDTYLLQVSSAVDSKIYGQIVINNGGQTAGVNLSKLWFLFMIFGGFLVITAAVTFFLPLIVVKVNANRVYRENMRIARMKNPEAFAGKSGTLFQRIQNKLQKLAKGKKGTGSPVPEAEKPQEEAVPAAHKPKFTDMLRERRENRDFMQKGDKTKGASVAGQNNPPAAKASFAFLRDDDDEIASLHEEKEEVATIETGSYVQDGVTFAKLDSMQDEDDKNDEGK